MSISRSIEVTAEEVTRLLGELDTETLVAILDLHPSSAELEEAALRVAGNAEAVGGKPATGVVAAILDLLDLREEEDR